MSGDNHSIKELPTTHSFKPLLCSHFLPVLGSHAQLEYTRYTITQMDVRIKITLLITVEDKLKSVLQRRKK